MTLKSSKTFDPHESKWADALAGRPLATFPRRLAAYICDFVIGCVFFLPLDVEGQYLYDQWVGRTNDRIVAAVDFHNPWSLVWLVFYFGVSMWYWNGSTLGKRMFHIRVVSLVGPKISLWQSVERALGYAASALECGFGFIQYFIYPNRQCVHDRIAETVVLYEGKKAPTASEDPSLTPAEGAAAPIPGSPTAE